MANETTVTARCLCKAHVFETTVAQSSLPLLATACHCKSCRHARGSMYLATTKWPNPKEDVTTTLQAYSFTPRLTVYSCDKCGTPMFYLGTKPGSTPSVVLGCLDNSPGLVKYESHIFVGDTQDGGATMWLRKDADGEVIKRYKAWDDDTEVLPYEWPASSDLAEMVEAPAGQELAYPERTPVWCHCRGVDFTLRSAVDMAARPTEDLMPYINPSTCKYHTTIECCDSCRLAFGCDLVNWTFPPLSHLEFTDGTPFPKSISELKERADARDPKLGTLKYYQSSPDVERYFCSRCSASVFYVVHDRPDMVDLAVGLLDHPDGARADGLLSWNYGEVFWQADVAGGWREGLARGSEVQCEEWRVMRGYPKCPPRVLREEKKAREEEESQQKK